MSKLILVGTRNFEIEKYEIYTDVLVLGSGPSGFAAAYTAAKNGAKVIVLDERGQNMKSTELASIVENWQLNGTSEICFLIGGADGHLQSTRDKADLILSFGKLTLPHMLMRAVLAEQIYRIQTIIAKHPYHRE